jgi:phospholipid N-methyltransferase
MSIFTFIKEASKNISQVGAVCSSSKFLAKKLTDPVDFSGKKVIVEFGAGNGSVTRMILKKMGPDSILYSFEINPVFMEKLKTINDPRLVLINDSVEDIMKYVNKHEVDYVISCLPLANFNRALKESILGHVKLALKPGNLFIQFQYSLKDRKLLKHFFKKVNLNFTLLNVPPAFVYVCKDFIQHSH